MGMRVIQSGGCKVETASTKDLLSKSRVFFAASAQGLNSENGNLLPETGKIVQPRQETAKEKPTRTCHPDLHQGISYPAKFFHFLQT